MITSIGLPATAASAPSASLSPFASASSLPFPPCCPADAWGKGKRGAGGRAAEARMRPSAERPSDTKSGPA